MEDLQWLKGRKLSSMAKGTCRSTSQSQLHAQERTLCFVFKVLVVSQYKTFLPTSYSPKESCLKETENMLSIKELWQNVADYSMNEENQEWYQSTQFGDASSRDAQKKGFSRIFVKWFRKKVIKRGLQRVLLFLSRKNAGNTQQS